ncbi:MAG TPA: hypothetical protein DCM64_12075 [Gammaproteobacteria bacterium]|mgnify:FL=1|jgi:hypothetical protein|nr:hypothetical protein [Gammaproteobacteria bacterium]|tara:strand:+ start:431 stop:637 length:207 start_codon:yes stop_codon:yes gene_type:complete
MAACIQRARDYNPNQSILFMHTGGRRGFLSMAQAYLMTFLKDIVGKLALFANLVYNLAIVIGIRSKDR